MMKLRSLFLAAALLASAATTASAQDGDDVIAAPALRADVTVSGEVVRIGDVIDNAGSAAQIAIYRAPDLGTTGTLPTAQVLTALRAHQVIGVDTRNLQQITVTRLARTIDASDIERQVAQALERHNGLGEAANLSLTFDRDVESMRLEASNTGAMQPSAVRYDFRSLPFRRHLRHRQQQRFDADPAALHRQRDRDRGSAVLARNIDRNEVVKSSDVVVERRPKAEVGTDAASRDRAVGMQARRQLRAGQALKVADLAKPDLVQRDQTVVLIYEASGLYLTIRGKALEGGTEGDVVSVLNPAIQAHGDGTRDPGRGQVAISIAMPRAPETADATPSPLPDQTSSITSDKTASAVAVANTTSPAAPKPSNVHVQVPS